MSKSMNLAKFFRKCVPVTQKKVTMNDDTFKEFILEKRKKTEQKKNPPPKRQKVDVKKKKILEKVVTRKEPVPKRKTGGESFLKSMFETYVDKEDVVDINNASLSVKMRREDDINIHTKETAELTTFLEKKLKNKFSDKTIVSMWGSCGVGKTFIIESVCRSLGVECVYVKELMSENNLKLEVDVSMSDFIESNLSRNVIGKKQVIVLDCIESLTPKQKSDVITIISSMMTAQRMENIQMWPLICTCDTRYDEKMYKFFKTLSPTWIEVKAKTPEITMQVMRRAVSVSGTNMRSDYYQYNTSCNGNMMSLMSSIELLAMTESKVELESCGTTENIFSLMKKILTPQADVYCDETEDYRYANVKEISRMWYKDSFDRVFKIVYFSYPNFMSEDPFLGITGKSAFDQKYKRMSGVYGKSIEECCDISEAFSILDTVNNPNMGVMPMDRFQFTSIFNLYLMGIVHTTLIGMFLPPKLSRKLPIDLKSKFPYGKKHCIPDNIETCFYAHILQKLAYSSSDKSLRKQYLVSRTVGMYRSVEAVGDRSVAVFRSRFSQPPKKRKKKKDDKNSEPEEGARMKNFMNVLSRNYSSYTPKLTVPFWIKQ
jgi:hypothetical protein